MDFWHLMVDNFGAFWANTGVKSALFHHRCFFFPFNSKILKRALADVPFNLIVVFVGFRDWDAIFHWLLVVLWASNIWLEFKFLDLVSLEAVSVITAYAIFHVEKQTHERQMKFDHVGII